jgi:hypothetical protein
VLIQRDDVGPGAGEERTDRSHQPRPIGTAQQEPTHILYSQSPATCARILLLHLLQGVTPRCVRSQNPHMGDAQRRARGVAPARTKTAAFRQPASDSR